MVNGIENERQIRNRTGKLSYRTDVKNCAKVQNDPLQMKLCGFQSFLAQFSYRACTEFTPHVPKRGAEFCTGFDDKNHLFGKVVHREYCGSQLKSFKGGSGDMSEVFHD